MLFASYMCQRIFDNIIVETQENFLSRGVPRWNSWLDIFNYLRQTFAISAVNEKKGLFCFSFQHIDLWSRCNYSTLLLIHLEKLSWILNNFCSQQAEPKYTKIVVLFKFCYKFSTSSGAFLDELDGNFWTE